MTAAEYKAYYEKGYKTDVSHINITDKTMEFVVNGQKKNLLTNTLVSIH
ncbi:putative zinc-binding lipoprotein ZinT [Streptococcus constellatus]|nr:putative zinc-binding lipoprotein ZinT [Streptococcus constellatus]